MIITYHGAQHVKLQVGDMTIGYNPVSKSAKGKVTKYGANIALSSLHLPLYSGIDQLTLGSKTPFSITGPGEYETEGVFVQGVGVETTIDGKKYINTIYTFTFDSIKVCFLGSLSQKPSAPVREVIDGADIVFVGGGEEGSLAPYELYNIALSLGAKIIIPTGLSEKDLPLFLKEGGVDKREYLEKLTVKRKDVELKNGEVIALMEV